VSTFQFHLPAILHKTVVIFSNEKYKYHTNKTEGAEIIKLIFWTLIVVISCIAFYPVGFYISDFTFRDKINHIAAFVTLAVIMYRAYPQSFRKIAAYLSAYGIFIEIVQHFLPNRTFSFADFAADLIGIAFGYAAVKIHHRRA
jgi:hypothetical protein